MEKISKISRIVKKLYYIIFIENFNNKISYNFPPNYFRWDLIKYLHEKNNFKSYLEIGCDNNQLFSRINIKKKFGVDPSSGGNIRKTSDEFFKNNKETFDLVFIDGLHEYSQVKKDILNSLKFLNKDGLILVHDCLPESMSKQAVPRYRMLWNGDVWKAIVDLRQDKNIEIYTCEADEGISIIQNKKNTKILQIRKKINELKFKDFYKNYKEYMRIISIKDLQEKF
tara:strand:- start:776 stop:1453 length:678 start_codon:yes stop_codon:yes gene_type:complete